ncbi:MAG: single-stranded DNA-binding protein [Marinifilaceae bacterium]
MSVNKVILVGNVGKDPEVRYLEGGTAVCNMPLATSETYTNKNGEKVTQTEWHNLVLWRKTAEVAEKWVKKGTQLYVEGRLRTRSWEDQEGVKKYTTEIYVDNMQMLGRRADNEAVATTPAAENQNAPAEPQNSGDDTDDLPF